MTSQLPKAKNTDRKVDAIVLINKYVELISIVPNKSDWDEEILKDSPPAFYRLLQLKGLCKAFKVGSIELLLNGEFLFERDMDIYRHYYSMRKSMEATRIRNKEYEKQGSDKRCHVSLHLIPKTKEDIQYIIDSYKEHLYFLDTFLSFKNGKQCLFSDEEETEHTDFIIRMAKQNICQLITPERETFVIKYLIEIHGCPDVNVYELDEFHK